MLRVYRDGKRKFLSERGHSAFANENGLKGESALQAIHDDFLNQKCVCKPMRAIACGWPLDAPSEEFMPLICAKPPELAR
ncbi:hypothetical protein BH160DRAFT_2007 [Burkholderia sp. H160]|nr:hypothetical protein BH160DRAFT_2007 [Burkholderia sp. H160]